MFYLFSILLGGAPLGRKCKIMKKSIKTYLFLEIVPKIGHILILKTVIKFIVFVMFFKAFPEAVGRGFNWVKTL